MFDHEGPQVDTVAFSPDSRYAVSSSRDGVVRVWQILTRREVLYLRTDHCLDEGQFTVAVSAGADYVATSCQGRTIQLWKAQKTEDVLRIRHGIPANGSVYGAGAGVYGIAFSPDGKFLASASGADAAEPGRPEGEATVRVWDLASGREVTRLKSSGAGALAFTPDNRFLLDGDAHTLRVWRTGDFAEVFTVPHGEPGANIDQISVSDDSRWVASRDSSQARLWSMHDGRLQPSRTIDANGFAFSRDSQAFVTGDRLSGDSPEPSALRLYRLSDGQEIARLQLPRRYIFHSPGGQPARALHGSHRV